MQYYHGLSENCLDFLGSHGLSVLTQITMKTTIEVKLINVRRISFLYTPHPSFNCEPPVYFLCLKQTKTTLA